ncbi:MAG: hypothetical protein LBK53_06510 [Heliobacteriaceae bacterium]|jgi:hypothetical protein|nr:hypothetical protein [Heliobacteriaceae bacterium]
MYLSYFEEPAYDKLRQDISNNVENYIIDDTSWLDAYFNGLPYAKISGIMVNDAKLDYEDSKKLTIDEKNAQDLTNVRLLYDAFKKLTPLQATNRLMWSHLAHTRFKGYTVSRWINDSDTEDNEIQGTIAKRFFVTDQKGLIRMNAVSRLWWAGYLTYDENNSANPYHLTEILLTNQQIWADILDTPFCGNKKVIKGFLSGLKKYLDEGNAKTNLADFVRECVKYFRRYAAVTNVDFLDEAEITDIVYKFLTK